MVPGCCKALACKWLDRRICGGRVLDRKLRDSREGQFSAKRDVEETASWAAWKMRASTGFANSVPGNDWQRTNRR